MGKGLGADLDSGDLAQETQLRALEWADELRFPNRWAFRGWLQRVLRNITAQQGRRPRPVHLLRESQGLSSTSEASGRLMRDERRRDARHRLARLNERQRQIVEMRLWEDRSYGECGRRLGISENLARVTFHRAMTHLREFSGNPP
ncbi:MAG: sigma-70 family RNA polymerase sigma factor [Planctomycetota bacterium]|nr:sigma-70 family RNA polymerase sigma factor [Planctomycetota bacterium]